MDLEDLLVCWRTDPTRHGEQLGSRLYTLAYRYISKRVHDDSAKDLAQATRREDIRNEPTIHPLDVVTVQSLDELTKFFVSAYLSGA